MHNSMHAVYLHSVQQETGGIYIYKIGSYMENYIWKHTWKTVYWVATEKYDILKTFKKNLNWKT